MKKRADLQIEPNAYDLDLVEIRLEQLGYWLTAIILILGLIGLFGYGLYGEEELKSQDNKVLIKYDKFIHKEDTATLAIYIDSATAVNNLIKLTINQKYLDSLNLKYMTPPPVYSELTDGNINFYFRTSSQAEGMVKIMLAFEPHAWGKNNAFISAQGETLHFWQYVYP